VVAQDAPFVFFDVIGPKVIQTLLPIPPTKEIYGTVQVVNAHGMAAAARGDIPVRILPQKLLPNGLALTGSPVCVEQVGLRHFLQGLLRLGPVALHDNVVVQFCDQRVFDLETTAR
jgi:hypothetical protein